MPRSSSSNRSSHPVRPLPARPTPTPVSHYSLPPAMAGSTLGQSIKDGVGLGIGSSLGQRAVSWIFGPPTVQTVSQAAPTVVQAPPVHPCDTLKKDMDACFKFRDYTSDCFDSVSQYKECISKHK
jgi:hypothetical protein